MKITVKIAVCILCLMGWISSTNAQIIKNFHEFYHDANDSWEGSNDYEFNRINRGDYGMTLDGVFIKNDIGIDRYYEVCPDTTDNPIRFPFWIKGIGTRNDSLRV